MFKVICASRIDNAVMWTQVYTTFTEAQKFVKEQRLEVFWDVKVVGV